LANNDFSWVGALGGVNLFFFAWSATGAAAFLAHEQGVLQIGQLGLIAMALLMFLVSVFKGSGPAQTAAVALVGVSFCLFYRELDLAALGAPAPIAVLTQSAVRDIVLIVAVAAILGYVALNRVDVPAWWRFGIRAEAWPLFGSGILMMIGILIDITNKENLQAQFWEELVEFNSYVLFALAAGRHTRVATEDVVVQPPIMHH
jgi:hypothetical protein